MREQWPGGSAGLIFTKEGNIRNITPKFLTLLQNRKHVENFEYNIRMN
jgi:hypothetical protein